LDLVEYYQYLHYIVSALNKSAIHSYKVYMFGSTFMCLCLQNIPRVWSDEHVLEKRPVW